MASKVSLKKSVVVFSIALIIGIFLATIFPSGSDSITGSAIGLKWDLVDSERTDSDSYDTYVAGEKQVNTHTKLFATADLARQYYDSIFTSDNTEGTTIFALAQGRDETGKIYGGYNAFHGYTVKEGGVWLTVAAHSETKTIQVDYVNQNRTRYSGHYSEDVAWLKTVAKVLLYD